jgi:hypothetical protein
MARRDAVEVFNLPSHEVTNFKLYYDQRSVSQSVVVSGRYVGPMPNFSLPPHFFKIIFRQLWVCWCGAPSLMRGWVCNLLVQFSVTLRAKSRRTHDHILLSHLRLLGSLLQLTELLQQHTYQNWASKSKSKLYYNWQSVGQSILDPLPVEVEVTLRLTVSQYVLVSSTLAGLATIYYFLLECFMFLGNMNSTVANSNKGRVFHVVWPVVLVI